MPGEGSLASTGTRCNDTATRSKANHAHVLACAMPLCSMLTGLVIHLSSVGTCWHVLAACVITCWHISGFFAPVFMCWPVVACVGMFCTCCQVLASVRTCWRVLARGSMCCRHVLECVCTCWHGLACEERTLWLMLGVNSLLTGTQVAECFLHIGIA